MKVLIEKANPNDAHQVQAKDDQHDAADVRTGSSLEQAGRNTYRVRPRSVKTGRSRRRKRSREA